MLKQARDAYVTRLLAIYRKNLQGDGVTLIEGYGRLTGPQEVTVALTAGGEQRLAAEAILLATGGRPARPDIRKRTKAMPRTTSSPWSDLPRSVAIVGSGYIAVELAGVLHSLGTRVTLVMRGDRPLRSFDATITEVLARRCATSEIEGSRSGSRSPAWSRTRRASRAHTARTTSD